MPLKGQEVSGAAGDTQGQRILFLGNSYNRFSVECLKALVELGHDLVVGSCDASAQGAWQLIRNRLKVRGGSFVVRQALHLAWGRTRLAFRRAGAPRRGFASLPELCQAHLLKTIPCTHPNTTEFVQQLRALE